MNTELTDEQLARLRAALQERRGTLLDSIRSELQESDNEHFQDLAGRVHDSGEESVADLLSDLNLAIIDQHVDELRATEQALQRIAMGTYGVCVECGKPIEAARLDAYPTANRCIDHQRLYEKTHAGEQVPRL